jgi:hypothetical protein
MGAGRPKKYNTEEEQKQAVKDQDKTYYARNPLKTRNNQLKQKYGITLAEYNQMLFDQNGCCAICGEHHTIKNKTLHVDHCHTTGKVRGLLCQHCNTAIGKFKDDIKLLKNAIKYLK